MKIHHIILTAALVILFGGCEQKKPAQTEAPATPVQKAQQAGAKVKEVNTEPAKADKAQSPKVESSDKLSPAVVKVSTEQSLADISKHGREVTRTQESKSRTRAQMAEDEMQKDLENFKR